MNRKYHDVQIQDEVSDVFLSESLEDDYLDDFFSDDNFLIEELEPYEFLIDGSAANEELWDVIDINEAY